MKAYCILRKLVKESTYVWELHVLVEFEKLFKDTSLTIINEGKCIFICDMYWHVPAMPRKKTVSFSEGGGGREPGKVLFLLPVVLMQIYQIYLQ